MTVGRARQSAYRDDDPGIVLALRYATERRSKPSGSFLSTCAFYAVLFGSLIFEAFELPVVPRPRPPRTQTLFIPAPRTPAKPSPPPPKVPVLKVSGPKAVYPVDAPTVRGRVDLNAIRISVMEDDSNEIPNVVRQQHGELALVERDNQAIAHYVFTPPDWRMSDEIQDVSGMIRFSMSPPARWAVLRSLADRHSISMEKYEVDALFEGRYQRCLEQEIRKKADERPNAGRVLAAVLMFSSSRSCGFDVINLEFTDH